MRVASVALLMLGIISSSALGQDFNKIHNYFLNAQALSQQQKYLETAQEYEKAIKEEKSGPNTREGYLVQELFYAGYFFVAADKPWQAIDYYEECIELYRKLDPNQLMSVLNHTAIAYFKNENPDKAKEKLDESLAIAEGSGQKNLLAAQLHFIGEKNHEFGQLDQAIEAYERSYKLFDELNMKESVATELNSLGICWNAKGDQVRAIEFYSKAATLFRELNNTEALGITYNNIAEINEAQQKLLLALENYQKAYDLFVEAGNPSLQGLVLNKMGMIHQQEKQFLKSQAYYEKALEIFKTQNNSAQVGAALANLGGIYLELGNLEKAETALEEGSTLLREAKNYENLFEARKLQVKLYKLTKQVNKEQSCLNDMAYLANQAGKVSEISFIYNELGEIHRKKGEYDIAIDEYNTALDYTAEDNSESRSTYLNNKGLAYLGKSQFDKALFLMNSAYEEWQKTDQSENPSFIFNNIGLVYFEWGVFNKALKNFEKAISQDKKAGDHHKINTRLNNIGMVHIQQKNYPKALDIYYKILEKPAEKKDWEILSSVHSNLGLTHAYLKEFEKAEMHFKKALEMAEEIKLRDELSTLQNNLGLVYYETGKVKQAADYFDKAQLTALDQQNLAAACLASDNLGILYHSHSNPIAASLYLKQSVDTKEKLRLTAKGEDRRDYLASQFHSYQYLISAYLRSQNIEHTFETIERSRAKLMAERLGINPDLESLPKISSLIGSLNDDTAVLIFANATNEMEDLVVLGINSEGAKGRELNKQAYLSSIVKAHEIEISGLLEKTRGFKLKKKKKKQGDTATIKVNENKDLENIIAYYRDLLKRPNAKNRGFKLTKKKKKKAPEIPVYDVGKSLYNLLVAPMESVLENRKEVIIIPDGNLAFLPFETLIDKQGKYLVEERNIRYVQSINVLKLSKGRVYQNERKPIVAFGNPVYSSSKANRKTPESTSFEAVYEVLDKNGSVLEAYAAMGINQWDELPGTLEEVNTIGGNINNAEIVTGKEVTEGSVKRLFSPDRVTDYKIVHFATHGLAVPAVPELSALVLSQEATSNGSQDGYLRIGEIADLKIKADFVNLSACETGLGKIYKGEGVVGLTQSFMIAGANAVSVSLWQVADKSTSEFMIDFYKVSQKDDVSFAKAMNIVKRKFIEGEFGKQYRDPFYWAPFVYYGN